MTPRDWLRVLLSTVLAAGFGWLAWRMASPDADQLKGALLSIRIGWLAGWFVIIVAAQAIRTVRWSVLLRPLGGVPMRRVVPISLVGYMAVFTLPGLGEFVRPYLVREHGGLRGGAAMATVVVERILDGILVALVAFLAFLPLLGKEGTPIWVYAVAFGNLGLFLGVSTLVALLAWKREGVISVSERILSPISKWLAGRVAEVMKSFLEALSMLASRRVAVEAIGATLIYWALNGFSLQAVAAGFGINLSLQAAWGTIGIIVIGFMIPALGQVGTYHVFCLLGFGLFLAPEVVEAKGLALAITVHGLQVLVFGAAGILALFSKEVRWVRKSAGGVAALLVLLIASSASAKTAKSVEVAYDEAWSSAVRFVRVDRGYEIADKDKQSGYLLFTWTEDEKTYQASLELIARKVQDKNEVRMQVDCKSLPAYQEAHFLDRLAEKIQVDASRKKPTRGQPKEDPKEDPKDSPKTP